MYPAIRCGEHLDGTPVAADELRRGDVVLARHERGLTAHRIVRLERQNGRILRITTRGDNCRSDDHPVTPAEILGRVRARKPRLLRWLMCAAAALLSATANATVITNPAGFGVARAWSLGEITDAQIKQQRDLAAEPGLKIFVAEEGWQRVTNAAMLAAGFDPGDGSRLALYCAGIEQPLTVDAGGIGFYGIPL